MERITWKVNQLITKIKAGEEDAKKELFDLTYDVVRRMVSEFYPNNPFGAEDALTFIYRDIFRNLKYCKASEDGYAWICKRAKEDLWEHYRRFVDVRLDCIERDFASGKEVIVYTDELDDGSDDFSDSDDLDDANDPDDSDDSD